MRAKDREEGMMRYEVEWGEGRGVHEPAGVYNADRDFTSLAAWKKAREVKLFFYKSILPELPGDEKYNLGSQVRRASVSVTANIAEGYGRFHYQEGIQYYRIARGSLYELKDHLISCYNFGYVKQGVVSRRQRFAGGS